VNRSELMAQATAEHGPSACRVRDVLSLVGDKWSLITIHVLAGGPLRFMELRRDVGGISQRILTVTLRALERDGLVRRTVYPVVPPRVDYELTGLGVTLLDSVRRFVEWTLAHADEVELARNEYDARQA
jgi:DNA-binding HxlR family transcriptional regulator